LFSRSESERHYFMSIVLGVCGFGNGHSVRQTPILEGLIQRGHAVFLITNDQSYHYFSERFPHIPNARVYVPVIHSSARGIDLAATAQDKRNILPDANAAFWGACERIERAFGGPPDLVISDYDAVSAQIAYLFSAPLVTLDQQSKFLGYAFPALDGFTPDEHRMRLSMFFPTARQRIATSFYTVDFAPRPAFPVTIIPPIIGHDVKRLGRGSRQKHIAVYISAANLTRQSWADMLAVFREFPGTTFCTFTPETGTPTPPNVISMPNSRVEFLACLRDSAGVIATAGHNLISEALYLQVPLYLLPFHHYEQLYNAEVIASEGLGVTSADVTPDCLSAFITRLDDYRARFTESTHIYSRFDGDVTFLDMLGL
jgi:uncharacterized protein (TIGR00661 family)